MALRSVPVQFSAENAQSRAFEVGQRSLGFRYLGVREDAEELGYSHNETSQYRWQTLIGHYFGKL